MMWPISGERVLPSEGMEHDSINSELTAKTRDVLESESYKTLSRKYCLSLSRVS